MKTNLLRIILTLFSLLTLFSFSFAFSRKLFPGKVLHHDGAVLLQLKRSFSDPNGVLSTWVPENSNHCSWHGVSCNSDSKVISLTLNGQISGEISPAIGDLSEIRVLSLSFKGEIPKSLWGLKKLEMLDLKGDNFRVSNHIWEFQNHRKLMSVDDDDKKGLFPIEIASIVSISVIVVVLIVLIVLMVYSRKWRRNSQIQVVESKEIQVFSDNVDVPITYESIVRATNYFSNSNCIGHGGFGSTYKAEVSPEHVFAVKRLSIGRFQGDEQFHAEISALETVRHPNLVMLIGYYASDTEMFLIYNYLSGGNLEDFIKGRSKPALEWRILHKIALDVATALAYLHEQCSPKVLHRDIKPSNILLDENYNAYLSDFGLSKLLGTSQSHVTTGVAGTFGYVAPEYAMTCRVSEKADVYSYGIVVLELISDKRALDPSFSSHENGFNIVSWAHMMLSQGKASEVFTKGLWETGPEDELVEVLHLALKCTVESLSIRPTMKQAVKQLKRIQYRL